MSNSSTVRLYVGGLAPHVKSEDVKSCISKQNLGNVTSVEIMMCKWLNISRGFGYVTIQLSPEDDPLEVSTALISRLNGAKWKGQKLKIQEASPDFKEKWRLESEAADAAEAEALIASCYPQMLPSSTTNTLKAKYRGRRIVFNQDVEELENTVEREPSVSSDADSTSTSSESESEEPSFEMSEAEINNLMHEAFAAEEAENEQQVDDNAAPQMSEAEINNVMHEALAAEDAEKKIDANQRRLEGLARRAKEREIAAAASKKMASINSAPQNTKISFADSDAEEANDVTKVTTANWMSSSSEEEENNIEETDDDDSDVDRFKVRPEFQGSQGKKLFQMQQRFGGDDRFKLNEHFMNDDNEFAAEDDEANDDNIVLEAQVQKEEENNNLEEEEDRAMDVLRDLFPNIKPNLPAPVVTSSKDAGWNGQMRRYDPSVASDKKFEVKETGKCNDNSDDESHTNTNAAAAVKKEKSTSNNTTIDPNLLHDQKIFKATSCLNNMFSRVRKNSEDGVAGESALDGFMTSNNNNITASSSGEEFKLSSLFGNTFEDVKEKTNSPPVPTPESAVVVVPNYAEEVVLEVKEEVDTLSPSKSWEENLIELGASFYRPADYDESWVANRTSLTNDFKRKHKQAIARSKQLSKRQKQRS